ncbi:MAG: cache domain-containing protein [Deltaproteobacteria bacterium]|nr:cache domain-containing protein [Candidatus Deferrimicrobium borealis]
MRKVGVIAVMVLASMVFASSALAESATKDECVTKVKEAVQLINEKGLDAAITVINKKDGGFAWKDSYVFVVDFQGTTVANALFPDHVGRNQIGLANKDGRMIIQEFIEIAKTKGEGWSEYMWPKPAEMQKPKDQRVSSKKASYVLRVPGQEMFAVAGIHE